MDRPDVDPRLLERSLRFIRLINRALRYNHSTISHLEQFSRNWEAGRRIRIIDLGTGSADVPADILRWAQQRGHDVQIIAVDLHARTLAAAEQTRRRLPIELQGKLSLVRADVLRLPFEAGSFDYAITSLFLHHLDDDQVEQVLRTMGQLAQRGIIATDLLRRRRAYLWITLFTLFSNRMLRHDARVSVAQSFRKNEILALRDRAGVSFATFHEDHGHRFALAGEK